MENPHPTPLPSRPAPAAPVTVPLADGSRVVPGKVVCIGRNYAAHARELGNEVPEAPVVFLKPSTSLVASGGAIVLPPESSDVHHEVELVAVIGRACRNATPEEAQDAIGGWAVGLDMTARDLQAELKKRGLPWTLAKGFDTFAPLGEVVPAHAVADAQALDIELRVNGQTRQAGTTADMLHTVADLVAYVSSIMTLLPGDLVYTGTPEGVGPVVAGDELVATITGLPALHVAVERA